MQLIDTNSGEEYEVPSASYTGVELGIKSFYEGRKITFKWLPVPEFADHPHDTGRVEVYENELRINIFRLVN